MWKIALTLILALSGCLHTNMNQKNTLTFFATGMNEKPWSIYSAYRSKGNLYRNVFTQPLYTGIDGEIQPGIFKSWEWDKNTKSYIFEIDTRYNFGQGRELKYSDIEFHFLRVFISKIDLKIYPFLKSLKGIDNLQRGQTFQSGMCSCIVKTDPNKIKFVLKEENKDFLKGMADFYFALAPIEDYNDDLITFNKIPRGTGAFKIRSYDDKTFTATLNKRLDYFLHKKSHQVTEVTFINGNANLPRQPNIGTPSANLKNSKNHEIVFLDIPESIYFIDFNFENQYGKTFEFRKAIETAIDKTAIASDISNGARPHWSIITNPKIDLYENRSKKDLNMATEQIKKATQKGLDFSKKLTALYYGDSNKPKPQMYRSMEMQLKKIGIDIVFEPDDFKNLKRGQVNNIPMIAYSKILPFNDYMYSFYNYSVNESGFLNYDPKIKELRSLYEDALSSTKDEEKLNLARSLARLFSENSLQVPIAMTFPFYYKDRSIKKLNIDNIEGLIDFTKVEMY